MLRDHMRKAQHFIFNLDEGDAALFAHKLAAVPGRSLLIRCFRCCVVQARVHRYEHWYSLRDQMCLHQYKASPPRRAFIRWVPDLTVSPGAIPRFVLPRYCCSWFLYSVRSGRSSFHRAKPPPKSDNAIFGSLPRGQGVAVGESLSGRWGKGGLAAVKGPQGIQRYYSKPLFVYGRCGGSRNACKALVSSASQSHHPQRQKKVSSWDKHEVACACSVTQEVLVAKQHPVLTAARLSLSFASTSATVQGPLRRRNPGELGSRYQQTHCR
ncbi:hypothetical protein GGI35DRAFT_23646 [Trichoderma velutinum]